MYSQLLELIWKLYQEGSKDWNSDAEDIYEEIDQLLNEMEDAGFGGHIVTKYTSR
jgi:hypothetical protein